MSEPNYTWICTHEYEDGKGWVELPEPKIGPREATPDSIKNAQRLGRAWRADYDGDGPACKGKIWTADAAKPYASDYAFAPLQDWAEPNYGAVHLFYRNDSNAWEEL